MRIIFLDLLEFLIKIPHHQVKISDWLSNRYN